LPRPPSRRRPPTSLPRYRIERACYDRVCKPIHVASSGRGQGRCRHGRGIRATARCVSLKRGGLNLAEHRGSDRRFWSRDAERMTSRLEQLYSTLHCSPIALGLNLGDSYQGSTRSLLFTEPSDRRSVTNTLDPSGLTPRAWAVVEFPPTGLYTEDHSQAPVKAS
jgi:hypothetical protein